MFLWELIFIVTTPSMCCQFSRNCKFVVEKLSIKLYFYCRIKKMLGPLYPFKKIFQWLLSDWLNDSLFIPRLCSNCTGYIVWNVRIAINNEMESMWEEAATLYCKAIPSHRTWRDKGPQVRVRSLNGHVHWQEKDITKITTKSYHWEYCIYLFQICYFSTLSTFHSSNYFFFNFNHMKRIINGVYRNTCAIHSNIM
jgi:hypothetical protein